jgi:hypothetical protein
MEKKVFLATYPDGSQKVLCNGTDPEKQEFLTGKWVPLTDKWDGLKDRREQATGKTR